ncbi:MAG: zinc dependent phospholipase C family protein [Bdellovibrionales bacterium]|nr:zinc dependent phospholipase C family protein [Bdellovibrionales bacterium]
MKRLPCVANVLDSNLPAAYLGAIAHDAPYYYHFGASEEVTHVAEVLHGRFANDTLAPVRKLLLALHDEPTRQGKDQLAAFILGFLSHYCTDVVFHPLIVYLTGDYYADDDEERRVARTRHRLFETYLDAWFRPRAHLWNRCSIPLVLSSLSASLPNLAAHIDDASGVELSSGKQRWLKAFRDMALCQRLFFSTVVGAIAAFIDVLIRGKLAPYRALSSYRRWTPLERFSLPFEYRNPITDEPFRDTVLELADKSTSFCLTVFATVEHILAGKQEAASAFADEVGSSLDVGIPAVSSEVPRHVSHAGIDLPGLEFNPDV